VGSDLHDPQSSEVSQDLFWIERQFPCHRPLERLKEAIEALNSPRKSLQSRSVHPFTNLDQESTGREIFKG
jgi:hypothetical protein